MKLHLITALILTCITVVGHSEPLNIKVMADFIPQIGDNPQNEATRLLLTVAGELSDEISLQFIPASRLREWQQLSKMHDVCLYNKLKTPAREAVAVFSKYPLMAFPTNKLIVFNKPNLPNEITLNQAIYHYGLTIGVTRGRSYSAEIDKFIHLNQKHFFSLEGATNAPRLGYMLFQNKIDAVIEYQNIFASRYQRAPELSKVKYILIKPHKSIAFGYIACSPSATGKQAIALFNNALKSSKVRNTISKRLMEIFPEDENILIVKAFKAEFEN